MLIVDGQFIHA